MLLVIALGATTVFSGTADADEAIAERVEALGAGFPVEVLGVPLLARQALLDFYRATGYERAWQSPDHRQQLISAVETAVQDGLDPEDYHSEVLYDLAHRTLPELSRELQADMDLLLSDAFMLLGSHLLDGKVNPKTLQAEWTANRRQRRLDTLLKTALSSGDIAGTLQSLRPNHSGYQGLVRARQTMTRLLGQPWLPIAGGPVIGPGDRDDRMPEIRRRLTALGDLPDYQLASDLRHYSGELEVVVPAFQARHGLEPDGLIGRQTLAALNLLPVERIRRIDASLERWRWLPESLGDRFVLVNIAGYELNLIDNGRLRLHRRVIVGQPYRQTPVFSDRIRYLVLNPAWTVPRTLMIEDHLPRILRDPDYLERLNIQVYQGWGTDRQRVDPATVDWASLSGDYFPYQLVQAPGPNNALGRIKFMFPNPYDIYLHDTPSQSLFGRLGRSFSAGCIRVEDPFPLAEQLLSGHPEWSLDRILDAAESSETRTIVLPQPIPVYIQYWTAWVDEHGGLQLRDDIYNRDNRLINRLRETPSGDAGRMTPTAVLHRTSASTRSQEQP
ncbi:L,D-transpeptidase family protein [Marinobacter sp. CAU 1620]|nr:L,D-transpeptidase family protein [Marinobacter arenosus]